MGPPFPSSVLASSHQSLLLTGQRVDAFLILRGYTDLKNRNKHGLGYSSVGRFTSPSWMPLSFRHFLLALSVPVASLWPSRLFLLDVGLCNPSPANRSSSGPPCTEAQSAPRCVPPPSQPPCKVTVGVSRGLREWHEAPVPLLLPAPWGGTLSTLHSVYRLTSCPESAVSHLEVAQGGCAAWGFVPGSQDAAFGHCSLPSCLNLVSALLPPGLLSLLLCRGKEIWGSPRGILSPFFTPIQVSRAVFYHHFPGQ